MKLMDKKLKIDIIQMLNLNATIDQLARANSVHWHGHVLRYDKNILLGRALYFKGKGVDQRKPG